MDLQNPSLAKIPILDTGKFEQWQFRIHQYLQHEHYALWEVIEFGDSYEAPNDVVATGSATEGTSKKKGWTVALTTEDMQKRKNDVKARTTVLLALPDEHQLRFSKYKTAKELWAAILKIFGGNKATKKTKKNLLKQQYGNFKAEGSETLEQTFNRVQAIRNRSDLDTMSLDDLYNHLKVYESEVHKKSKSNSQDMAFISSAKNSSGKEDLLDITQIDEDDMEEIDIKWNMALLSMRADRFWKKTGKKIFIQWTDGSQEPRQGKERQLQTNEEQAPKALMAIDEVGWDWSFMANEEEDHALVADEETPTEFSLMAKTSADSETGLPKFDDDTVTDYSRPSPAIESTSDDVQNRNPSVTETEASPSTISSKPFIKFVKASDRPTEDKTYKV
nr:hypothetical protein [Tanacetum cinerariifolium]